jgi:hypothetical protein
VNYVRQFLLDNKHSTLANYIVPGLHSHLLSGKARFFEATRDQEHFVVPHSHRYDFAACVIAGTVYNTLYHENAVGEEEYAVSYLEPGGAAPLEPDDRARFSKTMQKYTAGEWYTMSFDQFHTIAFQHRSLVLVLEGEERTSYSRILEPIVDGKHLRTFHRADWMQK